MSITARQTIRTGVVVALSSLTGVTVQSPGDWDVPGAVLPVIKVRVGGQRKAAVGRTMPEFNTTVTVQLQVVCKGADGGAAQDALEALLGSIEDVVYGNVALISKTQQISQVESESFHSSEGALHLAGETVSISFELFESFDPVEIAPGNYPALEQVSITLDSSNVFDPSGTYSNPPFPSAVQPAPRTSGPDGRAEGVDLINLPQ